MNGLHGAAGSGVELVQAKKGIAAQEDSQNLVGWCCPYNSLRNENV